MRNNVKYIPSQDERERILENVPAIIVETIVDAMERDCPIDTFNTMYYLMRGWLPPFVVIYFVRRQWPSRAKLETLFFRALHLIEALRERVYHPEHYLEDGDKYAKYGSRKKPAKDKTPPPKEASPDKGKSPAKDKTPPKEASPDKGKTAPKGKTPPSQEALFRALNLIEAPPDKGKSPAKDKTPPPKEASPDKGKSPPKE